MLHNLTEDELTSMLEQASLLADGQICTRFELRQFAAVVALKCISIGTIRDIIEFFRPPVSGPVGRLYSSESQLA